MRNSSGVRKFPHSGKRTHVPNRLNPPPILRSTQKKKNGSRSCALCSITSAGVLYTGCSPTQGSHAESTENSVYTSVRTLPVLLFPLCIRSAYAHLALLAVQTVAHNVSVHWEVVLSDRKRRMVFDERTKETSSDKKKKESNPPLTKENKSWRC